jgi:threonine dehydratase
MDKPGQLQLVSTIIAELGGNVISVHHERASEKMDINGCFLRIVLETKNYEHIEQVKQGLVNAGFRLV